MSPVTVWSKPMCVQCNAVKRWLDREGIDYEAKDLLDDLEKLTEFQDQGFLQAPIVESRVRETFSGFRPDALEGIRAALKEES